MYKLILAILVMAAILFVLSLPKTSASYYQASYCKELNDYCKATVKPTVKLPIREYAKQKTIDTFGEGQWQDFDIVVTRESHWNSEAKNPHSSAYGYGQFLSSTWKLTSYKKSSDPYVQIDATVEYIALVYGSPHKAKLAHDKRGWY